MIPDQDPMKTEQRQEKVGTQECVGLFLGKFIKFRILCRFFMAHFHEIIRNLP